MATIVRLLLLLLYVTCMAGGQVQLFKFVAWCGDDDDELLLLQLINKRG